MSGCIIKRHCSESTRSLIKKGKAMMLVPSHPDNAGLFKMRLEPVSQRNEDLI